MGVAAYLSFLRIDKAGNVTKRFNATAFQIAQYGGACPVWNLHTAFRTPGVIIPQFVEMTDGERFFTLSRTTERPTHSSETQDRRLVMSLGCKVEHAEKLSYANPLAPREKESLLRLGLTVIYAHEKAALKGTSTNGQGIKF